MAVARGADAYAAQLAAHLPQGDAWPREPGGPLPRLLRWMAGELARVDARTAALLVEADPRRTEELLAEWEAECGLPDECSPHWSFQRASPATWFDGAGVLREAAVDEPRYLYDATGQRTGAIILEGAGANRIRNPRAEGAAAGAPGTGPTNWFVATSGDGLTREVVGAGVEAGIPYIDVRYAGTPSATSTRVINFEDPGASPTGVAVGQTWTVAAYLRLVGGSLANAVIDVGVQEQSAAGANLTSGQTVVVPTGAALRTQRAIHTRTLANASVGRVNARLRIAYTAGQPIDLTLRIGAPQLEQASLASSLILPSAGAPAVAARAADDLYIATRAARRAALVAKLTRRSSPTPEFFRDLAATYRADVTITEHRPHTCEMDCEQPVNDEPWAHAWTISGPSRVLWEQTSEDSCETPLQQWRAAAYACAIRRLAPAHTVPIFSYA